MGDASGLGAVVVGTGFGVLTHLRALRAAGFEVRALVGRDAEKTATRAAMFGVPHALVSLDDALALPGVDAVSVATPPTTHAAIVLAAVDAGKHVMCEKPFARDLAEARAMHEAADGAGVVHLLGTEFRFATGQALLRRTVASGAIGEPRLGLFVLELPTLADPDAGLPTWWEDADQIGGWFGAYGTHVIDQVRTAMGEFASVSASLRTLAPRPAMTADDTYTVQFRLRNGAEGILHSSCATPGQLVVTMKVTGTGGAAWLQGDEVWVDDGTGPRTVPVPADLVAAAPVPAPSELLHTTYDQWHAAGTDLDPYTRLFGVLRDRIAGRPVAADPTAATFADGVAAQAVTDAVRRSSAEGHWIDVP